jgi:hypothetical protein
MWTASASASAGTAVPTTAPTNPPANPKPDPTTLPSETGPHPTNPSASMLAPVGIGSKLEQTPPGTTPSGQNDGKSATDVKGPNPTSGLNPVHDGGIGKPSTGGTGGAGMSIIGPGCLLGPKGGNAVTSGTSGTFGSDQVTQPTGVTLSGGSGSTPADTRKGTGISENPTVSGNEISKSTNPMTLQGGSGTGGGVNVGEKVTLYPSGGTLGGGWSFGRGNRGDKATSLPSGNNLAGTTSGDTGTSSGGGGIGNKVTSLPSGSNLGGTASGGTGTSFGGGSTGYRVTSLPSGNSLAGASFSEGGAGDKVTSLPSGSNSGGTDLGGGGNMFAGGSTGDKVLSSPSRYNFEVGGTMSGGRIFGDKPITTLPGTNNGGNLVISTTAGFSNRWSSGGNGEHQPTFFQPIIGSARLSVVRQSTPCAREASPINFGNGGRQRCGGSSGGLRPLPCHACGCVWCENVCRVKDVGPCLHLHMGV